MLDVPLLGQGDSPNCLPICVDMVLRYHGIRAQAATLRSILGTTELGTPFSNVAFLTSLGVEVKEGFAGDFGELKAFLAQAQPVICPVNTFGMPYWNEETQHAVVVVGIQDNVVTLNDPAFSRERQSVSVESFWIAWYERDFRYAVITPRVSP